MCACILGGAFADENLGKGPTLLLACNLHCHLGGKFRVQPRMWGMVPEGEVSQGCANLFCGPVFTARTKLALCSFSKWAEGASQEDPAFKAFLATSSHMLFEAQERGGCYFWILQSIAKLILHRSVLFLPVETCWLIIPKKSGTGQLYQQLSFGSVNRGVEAVTVSLKSPALPLT